jgi:hypothetical protein
MRLALSLTVGRTVIESSSLRPKVAKPDALRQLRKARQRKQALAFSSGKAVVISDSSEEEDLNEKLGQPTASNGESDEPSLPDVVEIDSAEESDEDDFIADDDLTDVGEKEVAELRTSGPLHVVGLR